MHAVPAADNGFWHRLTPAEKVRRARRVGRHMVANGLRQVDVAAALGVNVRTIQRWLAAERPTTKCDHCGRTYKYVRVGQVLCPPCRPLFSHSRREA